MDIFFGEVTASSARVYLRPDRPLAAEETLSGEVEGPICATARMLPLRAAIRYLGPQPQPLAVCDIPNPAFWHPELPTRYAVRWQVMRGEQIVDSGSRKIGLRRFGAHGASFQLDSKRWVLRGAAGCPPDVPPQRWQQAMLACSPAGWDDALGERAAAAGILLIPRLQGAWAEVCQQLRVASRCAAVWAAIIDCSDAGTQQRLPPEDRGNVLLIDALGLQRGLDQQAEWAQAALLPAERVEAAANWQSTPVVMHRPASPGCSPQEARRQCEVLQRDLTPWGDFAGYLV